MTSSSGHIPRTFTRIALVFTLENGYYRGVLRGIRQYGMTKPDWLFFPTPPESHCILGLRGLHVNGVIAGIDTEQLAEELKAFRRPLVEVSGGMSGLPFSSVTVDLEESGRLAAQHFLDCGLRHFGFFGIPHMHYSARREAGFREVVEAAGHAVVSHHDDTWTLCGSRERGKAWSFRPPLRQWLVSFPKPVGIFVPEDIRGLELIEACRWTKLRVPEDVAVLGVDNDDLVCSLARPLLSSVTLPTEKVGYEAAAMLAELLLRKKRAVQSVVLPPTGIAVRQSTNVLGVEDADVVDAIHFIRERAHMPLLVKEVVENVATGRRTLERKFARALGRSIWAEIKRVHLECAKTLLAETDLSIAAVAQHSGFGETRRFSRVFRHEIGMTPTAYRRSVQAERPNLA